MKAAFASALVVLMTIVVSSAADKVEFDSANPQGRPKFGIGKAVRCAIWHDANGWHLRTTCGQKEAHVFSVAMTIQDGKVGDLKAISAEKATKKGTPSDVGTWNKERTQFNFTLNTAKGGEDGFDFEVSEGATAIKFTIKIDGRDMTEWILIGSKGEHPAKMTFTLPAHPTASKTKSK